MPHLRPRYLQPLLTKSARYSVVTGIFGHRQVGKTTLASLYANSGRYITLDDPLFLDQASTDPKSLLSGQSATPLVIDECQLAPALFPAIKEWVRTHPRPGQFLLTGSVRFSSRKAIRESLTGRIIAWELLPMSLSEAHSQPLSNALIQISKSKTIGIDLQPNKYTSSAALEKYLVQGGLPGIFAIHDPGIRRQRFETQINTILERDLKLVLNTTLSYPVLKNLLQVLALAQGTPLEVTNISRQVRISVPTLKKLLTALEAIYVIRIIETEGTEKKPVLFFEDQGEATYLASNRYDEVTQLTRFLFAQIRAQWTYRPEVEGSLFQYRTRGGAYVPFCFRSKYGLLGIMPILNESPNEGAMASARSFVKAYPNARLLFVHTGKYDQVITSQMRVLGMSKVI
jgi:predicted AAA+ superfamily ATPase